VAEAGRLGEGAGRRMRRGEGAGGAWLAGGEGWPAGGGAEAARGRWPPAVLGVIWVGWMGDWGRKGFYLFLDI
jgi:hypothetical protein